MRRFNVLRLQWGFKISMRVQHWKHWGSCEPWLCLPPFWPFPSSFRFCSSSPATSDDEQSWCKLAERTTEKWIYKNVLYSPLFSEFKYQVRGKVYRYLFKDYPMCRCKVWDQSNPWEENKMAVPNQHSN